LRRWKVCVERQYHNVDLLLTENITLKVFRRRT